MHASEVGLGCATDEEILGRARRGEGVVTAELDYARLLALAHVSHPVLALFRGGNFSEAERLSMMGRVLAAVFEADLLRSIVVVDLQRVRHRILPV